MKRSDEYLWDVIEEQDKTNPFKRRPDYEYEGVIYPDEEADWEFEEIKLGGIVMNKYWTKGDWIDCRMGTDISIEYIEGALFIDDERIEL
jgi:hypothetical protein